MDKIGFYVTATDAGKFFPMLQVGAQRGRVATALEQCRQVGGAAGGAGVDPGSLSSVRRPARALRTDQVRGREMQIILATYKAKPSGPSGLFSILMNIGKTEPDPMPRKVLEVKNAAEAVAAFDAYVAEAKATGKLVACTFRAGEGRKAPGFDKAKAGFPPYVIVNAEVAQ